MSRADIASACLILSLRAVYFRYRHSHSATFLYCSCGR